uniref:Uncharacterized protein n=1 Tax=Helicotheca tamesis TaxID=374047 RepID=A0A7S2I9P7_9STRA|mmetsp:Transcript_7044/g.9535  ORF Transcript_7044/g.9535 Transcript_7044/m.9535 type:complete len:193 (+) Transcript_7044:144-722(+)|eukprot:CAMPEP_0185736854 /NCGR_PEP_ID=MMETSP1171-20130828/28942_1 /TAXON_ID=374046 /ORGANISM="Helicotheca tamensis, Strain CCMP826" /LENGTH=192 /DNA_ID=CAMNT_0028407599 /DNA_START=90 /DNA_END=668 /DNA_ORIENTATION=+
MVDALGEGMASLVAFSGLSVPARARFVGHSVASATFSSLTVGLVCGQVGVLIPTVGPLVPFLVGSWTGCTYGLYGVWRQGKQRALLYAQKYPKIMAHAFMVEFHKEVPESVLRNSTIPTTNEEKGSNAVGGAGEGKVNKKGENFQDWICNGGLGRLSFAILASQSCHDDIVEIEKQERERLMEEYREKKLEE